MKTMLTVIIALTISVSSFGSCREKLLEKHDQNMTIALGGGLSATSAAALGVFVGLPIIAVPGMILSAGGYWVLSGNKPKRIIKLIEQADTCTGRLVGRAYKHYKRSHKGVKLTRNEFCDEIIRLDRNGALCDDETPSIKQISKYYIVE